MRTPLRPDEILERNLERNPPKPHAVNGAAIRERRDDAGLSIADLAGLVGISPFHLNNIELGNRQTRPHIVARMARALGCEPAELRHQAAA